MEFEIKYMFFILNDYFYNYKGLDDGNYISMIFISKFEF